MKQPSKQKAFSPCTLKELCPEDKQKVAKLVKQVVELGQENQRLKDAVEKAPAVAEEKIKQIQECNKEAVRENCSLKTKLGQAVTVLRMYHHKVQGLDAALRAMQNAAAANDGLRKDSHDTPQQQQQIHQQEDVRIIDGGVQCGQQAAATGTDQVQQDVQQAETPSSLGKASYQHSRSSSPASSAAAAAARLQQQAQQLSDLMSQQKFSSNSTPGVAAAATPPAVAAGIAVTPASSCGSTAAAPAAVLEPYHLAGGALATAVPAGLAPVGGSAADDGGDEKLLPVAPLVLPPHCSVGAREVLRDLAHWQLQQGLITPGQVDRTFRKVLQFDPSVGSHGAFVIRDLPELAAAAAAPDTATAMYAAAAQSSSSRWPQVGLCTSQHILPDSPLPVLGHASSLAISSGTGSKTLAAPDIVSCTIPCKQGIAGLSDASPWEIPADKQLMNIAATFDSLAAVSPASGAARSSHTAAEQSVSTTTVPDVGEPNGGRTLPFGTGGMATGSSLHATAAASGASSSCSILSVEAGPAAEQSVEEVAVEAVDAWRVPVVVQNEKSWSSLHGPASPLMMEPTQQQQWPEATDGMPAAQEPVPQQQQHSQQAHSAAQFQSSWQHQQASMQQHSQQPQEAAPVFKAPSVQQQAQVQQQYTLRTQQHLADLQQQRPHPASAVDTQHGATQQPWHVSPQQQQHRQHQPQLHGQGFQQQQQQPPSMPEAYHHHQQQVVYSSAGPAASIPHAAWREQETSYGQQQQYFADSNNGYGTEHDMQHQYGMQHCSTDQVTLPDSEDTREMLERFDESLVDLLMEVERLEQQQQVCKQELQQQQQAHGSRRPLQQLPPQQWSTRPSQANCQQQWQQQGCAQSPAQQNNVAAPHKQCVSKWPQPQQRRRPQHAQQQTYRTSVNNRLHQQDADEDDVVSEILNHLD